MVAPEDTDVPLITRTNRANSAKADFYISIHANALNGIWGNQQGVSTYHYPTSSKGKAAAATIHKYLIQGTTQKDRGVLSANFHVLRETKMPSVLVECAFMDNLKEAGLLLTEAFRQECADDIAKGICEIFGKKYVAEDMSISEAISIWEKLGVIGDPTGMQADFNAGILKASRWHSFLIKTAKYVKKG